MDYPIVIAPLSDEDGGGFVGIAPDLPGCMSDGESPEQALASTREAIREWIETANRRKMEIPAPGTAASRVRAEREHLVARIREVTTSVDQFEARLQDLELMVREIEEKIEHVDAWERFSNLANVPAPGSARQNRLLPC